MAIKAPSVRRALDDALRSHPIPPRGEAAVALAKRLASDIDASTDPELTTKLAGRYLPVLEALGMTMKTQAGGTSDGARSVLDELQQRRARLGNAAAGD